MDFTVSGVAIKLSSDAWVALALSSIRRVVEYISEYSSIAKPLGKRANQT